MQRVPLFLLLAFIGGCSPLPAATLICSNGNIAPLEVSWNYRDATGGTVVVTPGSSLVVPVADDLATVRATLGGSSFGGPVAVASHSTVNVRVDAGGMLTVQGSTSPEVGNIKDLIIGVWVGVLIIGPILIMVTVQRVSEETI